MTTDERRARALWQRRWPNVPINTKTLAWRACMQEAQAFRQDDEASGMVLVPREATEEMLTEGVWDISPWHPAYDTEEGRRAAMRDAWNGMIATATEADHG